nr:translation initiation factor IF-2-like [Manis javanica]
MSGDSVSAVSLASNRVEPGSGLQCLHRARWPVHAAAAPDPGGSRSPAGPPLPARGHLRPDAPAPDECRPPSALRVPRGDSGAPAARAALPASPGCAARPPGPRPRRHLRRRSRRGPAAPQAGGRARRPWSGAARGPEPGRAGADGPRPSSPWRRRNRGGHRRARPTPGLRAQGGSRAGQGLSAPQRPRGLGTYPTGAPPAASPGGAHRICDPSRCGNRRTVGAPRPAGRDTVASAGGAPKGRSTVPAVRRGVGRGSPQRSRCSASVPGTAERSSRFPAPPAWSPAQPLQLLLWAAALTRSSEGRTAVGRHHI